MSFMPNYTGFHQYFLINRNDNTQMKQINLYPESLYVGIYECIMHIKMKQHVFSCELITHTFFCKHVSPHYNLSLITVLASNIMHDMSDLVTLYSILKDTQEEQTLMRSTFAILTSHLCSNLLHNQPATSCHFVTE